MTQQREGILRIIQSSGQHLTAEQIFLAAKQELPSLAIGTVYNNLNALCADGTITRVQISRQMELEAGQPDAAMRRSLFLSGGTADQLYLAVRLAICRLLLPGGAPIVLDDALVMFDDERLQLALDLLRREAAGRQIFLFTCQSREKALEKQL